MPTTAQLTADILVAFLHKHSLLLRASTNEDASREAGDEVTGDAETRGQNVSRTVFHAVFLHDTQKRIR